MTATGLDASGFVGLKGGELVTFDRNGDDVASIAPADDGGADWQRAAP